MELMLFGGLMGVVAAFGMLAMLFGSKKVWTAIKTKLEQRAASAEAALKAKADASLAPLEARIKAIETKIGL